MAPSPQTPDLTSVIIQIIASNPLVAAIVSVVAGLYIVGKLDSAITPKKTEPTEEELETALTKLRAKKKSSPQAKELVKTLKALIETLEKEE